MVPEKAIAIAAAVVIALVITIRHLKVVDHSTTTPATTATTKKAPSRLPVDEFKFTRCDGIDEPLGPITISACPDVQNKNFCEILQKSHVTFTLEFTPAKYIADPCLVLRLDGPSEHNPSIWQLGQDETRPLKAHKKHKVSQTFSMPMNMSSYAGSAQLTLSDGINWTDKDLFCVEFPIKIVENL